MEIIYRDATEEDAYQTRYVGAKSWHETYTGFLPKEYLNYRLEHVTEKVEEQKQFLKQTKNYIVACDKEKIVGICYYTKCDIEKYKTYGRLDSLYVLEEYQGLGIGKELFKRAIKGLIDLGYTKMELECMKGNNTINFYQKYDGIIAEQLDYEIPHVGKVKADIVLFDNLQELYEKLNENIKKR